MALSVEDSDGEKTSPSQLERLNVEGRALAKGGGRRSVPRLVYQHRPDARYLRRTPRTTRSS